MTLHPASRPIEIGGTANRWLLYKSNDRSINQVGRSFARCELNFLEDASEPVSSRFAFEFSCRLRDHPDPDSVLRSLLAAIPVMGKGLLLLLFLFSLLAAAAIGAAEGRANKSSSLGGLFWATGKDESELLALVESKEEPSAGEDEIDGFAGGFNSLDSMLQWAIGKAATSILIIVIIVI
ncbi:hypothetical protein B296_00058196 [Ensete ventricosum]|uniref:Uncharacterized protein n=1 Tax=Ensete ventricosum TaxID=4639 RepID=A0A426XN69_ENSVE|nr:hypothetical protein B296_00058196 [Ensete ventricosum]